MSSSRRNVIAINIKMMVAIISMIRIMIRMAVVIDSKSKDNNGDNV